MTAGHVIAAGHVEMVRTDGMTWTWRHLDRSHDRRHVVMMRTQLTMVVVMIVLLLLVVRMMKLLASDRTNHMSHGLMVASAM